MFGGFWYTCKHCGNYVDDGDMINNICFDCMDKMGDKQLNLEETAEKEYVLISHNQSYAKLECMSNIDRNNIRPISELF